MSATPISVPVSVIWTVRSTGQSAEATPATPLQVSVAQVHIGLKGAQGLQGLQGLQGYKGDKGDKGDIGDVTPAAEAARNAAQTARDDALTHAGTAGAQAGVATTKAVEAAASVVLAETARDAAFVNADVYADVATGLAAVADGVQFQVASADGLTIQRWRRDAGPVAFLVATYPSAEINNRVALGKVITSADVIFAVREKTSKRSPFAIVGDARGTILNPHIQEIEDTANQAARSTMRQSVNSDAIAWAVAPRTNVAGQRVIALGVRLPDGMIINPAFQELWAAVFGGGGTTTGDLLESVTKILYGPHLFAVDGRAFTLYAPSLLPTRNRNRTAYEFALQSIRTDGVPLNSTFFDSLRVNASDLGASAVLRLKNESIDAEFVKTLTVVKSTLAKSGTPLVLQIGDSLGAGSQDAVRSKFDGLAMAPQFIGSRRDPSVGGSTWGEGRGGWRAADFVHINTQFEALPAGQEGTAIALQNDQRNPFIRVATGGDDPTMVKNGHIFDFAQYLTRFGFSAPDVVTINLGTNDINNDGTATGVANTIEAVRIMVAQIKAAAPACKVGVGIPQTANNSYFNPRWFDGHVQVFLDHHDRYGEMSGSGVYVLSHHAHLPDRYVFPGTVASTDAQTGQTKQTLDDGTHFTADAIGLAQYAESVFSFIHAIS